ncbi:MAG: adenylosuccinate lyase [Chloroflexi bacterium]|uniref:Adenylosuccinate lyase n=1 Tax=Candidatus Chlorohelix allophototropha TaxID=3003348 RepID=A0A8T7M419_9CHLR|nr:adenylosuccinate lyase [Chloroflexota bacterium]WJW70190.1 adenylosuccinate lyase [Chloroflexota bacterium L227-S17]
MIERYTRPEMGRIWSEQNRINKWLEVEIAVCEAWAVRGVIPEEDITAIRKATVSLERMLEIEKETDHDVIAFLRATGETVGEAARFIHLGLTSTDVVDTALSLQVKEAGALLRQDVVELTEAITRRALEHRNTIMIGRTHGMHAEPTTFGYKLAIWVDEMRRHLERLDAACDTMAVGKLSGAVGTHANIPPDIEADVCKLLGLSTAAVSTQTLQRDRHADFITTLALIGASLEKFSTEIRHLQRTEVREVEEPFHEKQQGSSAMPHKRNPHRSERIAGFARMLRGHAITALENVALWHERDISHSSTERVIFPDACILLDYALAEMTEIIGKLVVFPQQMLYNLESSGGLTFSQQVLLKLVEKGLGRQEAYKLVQKHAMKAWRERGSFIENLRSDPEITTRLSDEEIQGVFDYAYHLKYIDVAFERLDLKN